MDNPELYSESSLLQDLLTQKVLEEFWEHIKWNENGEETILDIGCGSGSVTNEILFPMLPTDVKCVLATDVNKKMINAASKKYCNNPKIQFDLLDIGEKVPESLKGNFNHVFSFFCLHWIKDQSLVMRNLFDLLKPGGDTFFIFVTKCDAIQGNYVKMSKEAKWNKYLENIQDILPPYMYEEKPEKVLKKHMENAGLQVKVCENSLRSFHFDNDQKLKDFLESVNPFVKNMTEEVKDEFIQTLFEKVKSHDTKKLKSGPTLQFYILIACASKPIQ